MNPCPCGYGRRTGGEVGEGKSCSCTDRDIAWYKKKISGPIIDRIDLWVSVSKVEYEKLSGFAERKEAGESSETIRKRIEQSRKIQLKRFRMHAIKNKKLNSEMSVSNLEKIIKLSPQVKNLVTKSAERLALSGRAFHRVLKVAQTIADLDGSLEIEEQHILEALQYRQRF
jgi:magnesium chelatase family protein